MVTDPVPALRGEPAPTNVAGFGDEMHGGMPFKPHNGDGLSYAARMELKRRAERHGKCKWDNDTCRGTRTTNTEYCGGHMNKILAILSRVRLV